MQESEKKEFNHFKIHSQYSICEGAVKIEELKDFCKSNKIKSVGTSDTKNLCGALEFSENISKSGTQPIIGTQIIFKYENNYGYLPLIAKNEEGYKKIIELSSKSFLNNNDSKYKKILKDLLIKSEEIENQSSPFEIVYGHNDLLAANFIRKNKKFYLVDWEYAGYNTPLFDLGGLSSNNNFDKQQEKIMLENYFEKKVGNSLIHKFNCIKAASLLRETMWSMVAEIVSKINFDYKNYTEQNLENFYLAYKKLKF